MGRPAARIFEHSPRARLDFHDRIRTFVSQSGTGMTPFSFTGATIGR